MSGERRPFAIYAITRHGLAAARRLREGLPDADLLVSTRLMAEAPADAIPLPLPLTPVLADTFSGYDCHILIISVGAVVRMMAPLLKSKKTDPAVICIDDAARFAVCVLSGHVGRGNVFTERVAELLDAQAVITTASDVLGTLTVDILGRSLGWELDDPDRNVTRGCAAVVNGGRVAFVQEAGEPDWWPLDQPLPAGVEYYTALDPVNPSEFEVLLVASDRDLRASHPAHWENAVIYRPRSLVLGLGCDRDASPEMVERGVLHLLARHGLSLKSVRTMATIDRKGDERAFLQLQKKFDWPLLLYSAEELDATTGIENPSERVQRHVGTRGVAEPAALRAAGSERLLITKQIYTEPGAGRSMTLAVARMPFPQRPPAGQHQDRSEA